MKYLSILTLALLSVVVPAKADTLAVSSTFTFGPSLRMHSLSESGNFSFNWDTDTNTIIRDSIFLSATGTLAPFTLYSFGTLQLVHAPNPYPFVTWVNADNDNLQLALYDNLGGMFPRLGEYGASYGGPVELWTPGEELWPTVGTLTVTPAQSTHVPEPGLLSMVLTGIASIFILYVVKGSQCPH